MTADPRDPNFPGPEEDIPFDQNMREDETSSAGEVDVDALPEGEEIPEEAAPTEEENEADCRLLHSAREPWVSVVSAPVRKSVIPKPVALPLNAYIPSEALSERIVVLQ